MIQRPLALTLTLAGLLVASATAQLPRETKEAYPNFDIRDQAVNAANRTPAAARAARAMDDARAALAARVPTLHVEMNRAGNAPEVIGAESATQFLAAESSKPIGETARAFLTEQAALYGLTTEQAKRW